MSEHTDPGEQDPLARSGIDFQAVAAEHQQRQELLGHYREMFDVLLEGHTLGASKVLDTFDPDSDGRANEANIDALLVFSQAEQAAIMDALLEPASNEASVHSFQQLGWNTALFDDPLQAELYSASRLKILSISVLGITHQEPATEDYFRGFDYGLARNSSGRPDNMSVCGYYSRVGAKPARQVDPVVRDVETHEINALLELGEIIFPSLEDFYRGFIG